MPHSVGNDELFARRGELRFVQMLDDGKNGKEKAHFTHETPFFMLPGIPEGVKESAYLCLDSLSGFIYDFHRIPVALGMVSLKQD